MRNAREAVLDAFLARFDRVPAPVEKAVAATDDLALPKEWHRAVIRAQDPVAAEAVFAVKHRSSRPDPRKGGLRCDPEVRVCGADGVATGEAIAV